MNKILLISLTLLLTFSAFSQNLVKVNDYSKNFSKKDKFSKLVLDNQQISVFLENSNQKTEIANITGEKSKQEELEILDYVNNNNSISHLLLLENREHYTNSLILKKYTENNNLKWERKIEISAKNNNFSIIEDKQENLYLIGSYNKDFTIEQLTLQKKHESNYFILKIDKAGNFTSLNSINSDNKIVFNDFVILEDKIFLTGTYVKEFNNISSNGKTDAFVSVYSLKDFTHIKTVNFGGWYDDQGLLLKSDNSGNLVFVGNFKSQITIDNNEFSNVGSKDVFICKMNKNLDVLSANTFGTEGNDYITDFDINSFGSIYLTGTYRTQIERNEKQKDDLFFNTYILKANQNCEIDFVQSIDDSTNHFYNPQIAINNENNIFITANSGDYSKSENYFYEFFDCEFGQKLDLPEYISFYDEINTYTAEEGYSEYLWSNGTKNQQIVFPASGLYYLTTKDQNGCVSVDSVQVEIFSTALNIHENINIEQLEQFEVAIYPNPVKDFFEINLNNIDTESPVQIFIISESGSIVYYETIDNRTKQLNKKINTEFSSGNYIVKIINGKNISSEKIIIIK